MSNKSTHLRKSHNTLFHLMQKGEHDTATTGAVNSDEDNDDGS